MLLLSIEVYDKLLSIKFYISSHINKSRHILGYGMLWYDTSISMFCSQPSKNSCFINSHTCNAQHVATVFTVF